MHLSTDKMNSISASGIRKVFENAKKLEKQGKRIVHMEIGRPDFDTPFPIKKQAIHALNGGMVHYTSNYGIDELREAVADKLVNDNGIDAKSSEIIITTGAIEGLALTMLSLLDNDDEVLIPNPCFTSYMNQVRFSGGKPILIPLTFQNNFKIDINDLENAITSKTKMVLINTPHNPTGTVYDYNDLKAIADFAKKNDLLVVSDECYEKITYDKKHISIASLPNMKERTVIINSASKSYSMTGWRVGFVSSNEQIIDNMVKIHQDLTTCASSFAQAAAVIAYKNCNSYINDMVGDYKIRRGIVMKYLDIVPDRIQYKKPEGAFYFFLDISKTKVSSEEFCNYMLNEAGVALVPGNAFGLYGEGFIRLSYTCSKSDLKLGMENLVRALVGM